MAGTTFKGWYSPDHPVYQQPSTISLIKFDDDELEDDDLLETTAEAVKSNEKENEDSES